MKWIIYCHLNKINRKRYIGQTSKKCAKYRFVKNGNGYSRQPKFYNAIKKYGWDNFEHIILEDNIKTQEEANLREQYYIKKYNTIKDGYNCTEGGNTAASYVKKSVNQYTLDGVFIQTWKSLSAAGEGTNIAIGSITKCCKGELKSAGNFIWRYNTNNYSNIEKWFKKTVAKAIKQYSKDGKLINTFKSAKNAEENTGIARSQICTCCKHKSNSAGNYVWRYLNEEFSYHQPNIHTRPIVQLDKNFNLIKEWISAKEAGRQLNINAGNIGACCRKERNFCGNFIWMFKEDYYKN